MPTHEVLLHQPPREVVNADVRVEVWSDDQKLGELRISRGTLDWAPAHHEYAFRLDWERFDTLMRDHGSQH